VGSWSLREVLVSSAIMNQRFKAAVGWLDAQAVRRHALMNGSAYLKIAPADGSEA